MVSQRSPYRVEATLCPTGGKSARTLADTFCSCPRGGFCKHLVALLLIWLHEPESFVVRVVGYTGRIVWQNESITERFRRRDQYGDNHYPSSPHNPLPLPTSSL